MLGQLAEDFGLKSFLHDLNEVFKGFENYNFENSDRRANLKRHNSMEFLLKNLENHSRF
jgi:hypothetical protein